MYVILGATGNTGSIIAENLLKAGKQITVVGRDASKLEKFTAQGAIAAIGDMTDAAFLTKTFKGATTIYALIPPNFAASDWATYRQEVIDCTMSALTGSSVKNIVLLSSIGAHLPEGMGPIGGLYKLEQALKTIKGLNVKALRAGFFMENMYGSVGMIQHMGINGSSVRADIKTPMVHTRDIAAVATKHLLALDFTGFSVEYVAGAADLSFAESTAIIGKVLKKDLPYVVFDRESELNGMLQAGLPQTIAEGYSEMNNGLNTLDYYGDYVRTTENTTPTTVEWFVENQLKYAFATQ
jgi:uncharacterized protein YbjT (DUF2867 family)